MDIKIVPLEEKYISAVAKIESELIKKVSKESLENTLHSNTNFYLVMLKNDKVIGFLEYSLILPESELYEIAIAADWQGNDYSKVLLNYYITTIKNCGCDTIFLEVNIINKKAISLYKKFGFSECGIRKNYYGKNEDAILMKLKI